MHEMYLGCQNYYTWLTEHTHIHLLFSLFIWPMTTFDMEIGSVDLVYIE